MEAASDLYASPWTAFRKVTWPLSLPGVVAGTLLTFIPAAGDYINSQLLGNTQTAMIGQVIDGQFLRVLDYPTCRGAVVHPAHPDRRRSSRSTSAAPAPRSWSDDRSPLPRADSAGRLAPSAVRARSLGARALIRSPCCVPTCCIPNIVVVLFSFNDPVGRYNYTWTKFSTDAWTDPCGAPGICDVARRSACGSA